MDFRHLMPTIRQHQVAIGGRPRLRQIQDECTPDLLFEVVILTLERSEGEGSLYFVFVLSHMRQGKPTLILL
jgi:hypothetical protein